MRHRAAWLLGVCSRAPCGGRARCALAALVQTLLLAGCGEIVGLDYSVGAPPPDLGPACGPLEALRRRLGLPAAERYALDRICHRRLCDAATAWSAADRILLRAVFIGVSSGALRFRRAP